MRGKIDLIIKRILLGIILIFLFLPLIQNTFELTADQPLKGYFEPAKKPDFSWKDWFENRFQEKEEIYLNEKTGFRNWLIRLHNQMNYSLFQKSSAQYVIVGKQNYLYEDGYITAVFGKDFIGDEKIRDQIRKLKYVQDTLRRLNKLLLVIIAPGKGTFFPEYIPDQYRTEKKRTNYEATVEQMNSWGLKYLDFNSWFIQSKHKSPFPLYPQYGIHWSVYGAMHAFDSILHFIEADRKIKLPGLIFKENIVSTTPHSPDDDIYAGMNLMYEPVSYPMAYPKFDVQDDSTRSKPVMLTIGDSYWWNIFGLGLTLRCFKEGNFWYYFKDPYPESFQKHVQDPHFKLMDEIKRTDIIIILCRQADLQRIGWGFIDESYALFCSPVNSKK